MNFQLPTLSTKTLFEHQPQCDLIKRLNHIKRLIYSNNQIWQKTKPDLMLSIKIFISPTEKE